MPKETYIHLKRDLWKRAIQESCKVELWNGAAWEIYIYEKRQISMPKETYIHLKRDLWKRAIQESCKKDICCKRSLRYYMWQETRINAQKELCTFQKRPRKETNRNLEKRDTFSFLCQIDTASVTYVKRDSFYAKRDLYKRPIKRDQRNAHKNKYQIDTAEATFAKRDPYKCEKRTAEETCKRNLWKRPVSVKKWK